MDGKHFCIYILGFLGILLVISMASMFADSRLLSNDVQLSGQAIYDKNAMANLAGVAMLESNQLGIILNPGKGTFDCSVEYCRYNLPNCKCSCNHDSDNGLDYFTAGSMAGEINGVPFKVYDHCGTDPGEQPRIWEYYCFEGFPYVNYVRCGNLEPGNPGSTCENTAGTGARCTHMCGNGVCDPGETCRTCSDCSCSCEDGDGGKNYVTPGEVSGVLNSADYKTRDYCVGNNLYEYYCDGGYALASVISCPSMGAYCYNGYGDASCTRCGDGVIRFPIEQCEGSDLGGATCQSLHYGGGTLACTPDCRYNISGCVVADFCRDSDGGRNYTVPGVTYGTFNGEPYMNIDNCTSNDTLWEGFCTGSSANYVNISCYGENTTACVDGHCV